MSSNLITEKIILPSAATKLYGNAFDGSLTLRAMTTKEERIRLSGQSFYKTMSMIINECIVDNKNEDGTYRFNSENLTDFDFFAVCVKLRIISYGPMYKTEAVCPECGHKFIYKVDLSQLVYNLVPEDFTEPYDVGPLPQNGDTLGCRILRVKDRIDIENERDKILAKNPNMIGDPTFELEMHRRIQYVNGEQIDYVLVKDYVDSLISRDFHYYKEHIDNQTFGVVRYGTTFCENPIKCNGLALWILRPDREFFRPVFDD